MRAAGRGPALVEHGGGELADALGRPLVEAMEGRHDADGSLAEALRSAVAALRVGGEANAGDLEVALLDRSRLGRRAFVRLDAERIAGLVGDEA